jgi:hypothetical protein
MNLEIISQIIICVFAPIAIWLISRLEEWKKWGFLIGFIIQPFWFYSFYVNKQWGMFFVTFFYTYSWLQGINNYILKNRYSFLFKNKK